MRRVRISVAGQENLYRFDGYGFNSLPVGVQSFVKSPKVRQVVGRWLPCPNWSVASAIQREAGK